MQATIVLLGGDGIGPEVVAEGKRVLEAVGERFGHRFSFVEELIGGAALDAHAIPLTDGTLAVCKQSDAVLLGAVGGPKWDTLPGHLRPEKGLLALRKGLGLWANLRPVKVHPMLTDRSPLRPERLANVDLVFVRELTGGVYFGEKKRDQTERGARAFDALTYEEYEIERVVRLAFRLASARRAKVTSVDKANVLESSRLWREVAERVAKEHPSIALEHQLVDSCAMKLLTHGASFDVVVTENMFGDILTDEGAALVGSLGMMPSASLGDGKTGLFEPIHGSAPDIAGKGIANPLGTILSVAMLLRHSLGLEAEAAAVEAAVDATVRAGVLTGDLATGAAKSTVEVGAYVVKSVLSAKEG
jgi:3-isopropylmalate dehydrogenase